MLFVPEALRKTVDKMCQTGAYNHLPLVTRYPRKFGKLDFTSFVCEGL